LIGHGRARFLLSLLFLLVLTVPATGDELSSWFDADPRARAYAVVEAELQGLIDAARMEKVPIGPLIDKLREGAAKQVAPQRLLDAVGETIDQLARARSVLEEASGNSWKNEADILAVSLLLRDLPDELAGELIAFGLGRGREMRSIRAAGDAITRLRSIAELEDGEALRVGTLLLDGSVPAFAYGSLPSVYLKAKASGLSENEILDEVIIGTLESGGGIIAMRVKIGRMKSLEAADGRQGHRPDHAGPPAAPPGQDKDKPEKLPQAASPPEPPGQDKDKPDKPPQAASPSEPPGQDKDKPDKDD
jgi:hypothetical protein